MRSTKSRTGWRALGTPCAVVALAVSLAGCGGVTVTRDEPSLDTDKIQSELQSKLADSIPGSTASVTCPSDVELQQGATFDCQVTGTSADGKQQAGQVEATVVDLGGGVSWRLVE